MSLRTDITQSHQIVARNLVLDRELIFLCVRQPVLVIESRRASDRTKRGKKLAQSVIRHPGRRMQSRRMRRRLRRREKLRVRRAGRSRDERRRKRRSKLAGVVSERSIADFIEVRGSLEARIENAEACANAGAFARPEDFAEYAVMIAKRIGQSQSRREIVPPRRSKRSRNMRVGGE